MPNAPVIAAIEKQYGVTLECEQHVLQGRNDQQARSLLMSYAQRNGWKKESETGSLGGTVLLFLKGLGATQRMLLGGLGAQGMVGIDDCAVPRGRASTAAPVPKLSPPAPAPTTVENMTPTQGAALVRRLPSASAIQRSAAARLRSGTYVLVYTPLRSRPQDPNIPQLHLYKGLPGGQGFKQLWVQLPVTPNFDTPVVAVRLSDVDHDGWPEVQYVTRIERSTTVSYVLQLALVTGLNTVRPFEATWAVCRGQPLTAGQFELSRSNTSSLAKGYENILRSILTQFAARGGCL
ncbi:hypothetical protein [Deinococcus sp. QL22]|uniref:hypothetical protein n=1 Tax=Deinococcus sp. QL22 TaxID=2939437 RepID=UPI002016E29E|nr:hypothetical protein [Deinococcus sp. QL22]UQN06516.1 hypothetical protein M1R55_00940 [Deinococcus sp. QL22]